LETPVNTFDARIGSEIEAEFRTDAYLLTLATPADYDAVSRLSQKAGSDEISIPLTSPAIAFFIDRNPAGKGFLVLAKNRTDAAIIGYFLFYPKELMLRADSESVAAPHLAYLCVHLFVEGSYRRRGIFEAMTRFGRRLLERTSVEFLYTVPNRRSTPGFYKLGMEKLGTLPFWARSLKPPFSWIGAIVRSSQNVATIERASDFGEGWTDELTSLPTSPLVWGRRNQTLLNWRFPGRPDAKYAIWRISVAGIARGYVVTRQMRIMKDRALVVCDFWLESVPSGALSQTIDTALMEAESEFDVVILMATIPDPRLRREFWRAGLLPIPQIFLPQRVVIIGETIAGSKSNLQMPPLSNWAVTPYDWDVF